MYVNKHPLLFRMFLYCSLSNCCPLRYSCEMEFPVLQFVYLVELWALINQFSSEIVYVMIRTCWQPGKYAPVLPKTRACNNPNPPQSDPFFSEQPNLWGKCWNEPNLTTCWESSYFSRHRWLQFLLNLQTIFWHIFYTFTKSLVWITTAN